MTNGKLPKGMRKQIMKLRQQQQEMSGLVKQKESLKGELTETENALKEVKGSKENEDLYKITGTVMIKKSKGDLKEDLKDKKDILELRIGRLKKKIKKLKKGIKKRREDLNKQVQESGMSG